MFKLDKLEDTHRHLANLQVFKFININFIETSEDKLDCIIQLTTMPKQSFSFETEGTHSTGKLGVAGNVVYRNKNSFKGAEIIELKLKGALEAQSALVGAGKTGAETTPLFNTVEIGPEGKFYIPKLLFPVKEEKIPKRYNPKTVFTSAYNFQKRRHYYSRSLAKISFGYDWKESEYKKHIFNPLELNFVEIYKLDTTNFKIADDPLIKYSYQDHLTIACKYSFIFNNQQINKKANFVYFRANLEFAGNLLRLTNNLLESKTDSTGNYRIFNKGNSNEGIPFSQYFKGDIDFRYYNILNQNSTLVFRTIIGVGAPYGNSRDTVTGLAVLPFEKSYYAGGANDIRAWKARTLGPGSIDTSKINSLYRLGDIKLEGNIEYRFDITDIFQGAAFIDAGNIWLIDADSLREDAKFKFNTIYDDLAIGAGIGIRLNYTFIIIRLDAALPFKDPMIRENGGWVVRNASIGDINLSFGIGYPF